MSGIKYSLSSCGAITGSSARVAQNEAVCARCKTPLTVSISQLRHRCHFFSRGRTLAGPRMLDLWRLVGPCRYRAGLE